MNSMSKFLYNKRVLVITVIAAFIASGQSAKRRCPLWKLAFRYSETVKDTKRIKKKRETDSSGE